ncbi:MAG: GyrI-like domain-containing protein [Methanothrix sp.]
MAEITVIDEKPQLVAGMRRKGYYREIAEMLASLFEYAMSCKAIIVGHPLFLYHEKSVEEAKRADEAGNADIEVCVPILKNIPENDRIRCYELAGGKMAKAVHKGPYQECESTYMELFDWLQKNNHKIVGPIREGYVNDPREVEPDEILTIIYVPVS